MSFAARAGAIDLAPLWDFANPALSEQRFTAALDSADRNETLILGTQIARTHGMRGDFARARAILGALEPHIGGARDEARARHALEWGRTFVSASHPKESQTPESKDRARNSFLEALRIAREAKLDAVAIDAIHMLAFVDTAPADQLKWGQEALAISRASLQPAAKGWEASLRNNVGYALLQLGRNEDALAQFEQALASREQGGNVQAIRIARWMIARTLRAMGRIDEAIDRQLGLEKEWDAAGAVDPHVFQELELLYRMKNDEARARHYAGKRQAAMPAPASSSPSPASRTGQ